MTKSMFKVRKTGNRSVFAYKHGQIDGHPSGIKMFLTQPPETRFIVARIPGYFKTKNEGRTAEDNAFPDINAYRGSKSNTIVSPSGVTIGDFVKHLEEKWVGAEDDEAYIAFMGSIDEKDELPEVNDP